MPIGRSQTREGIALCEVATAKIASLADTALQPPLGEELLELQRAPRLPRRAEQGLYLGLLGRCTEQRHRAGLQCILAFRRDCTIDDSLR